MGKRSYFPRVTIHTEYYYRNFLTKTCTVGFGFSLAIRILVIVMPFFLAYSTGIFWPKTAVAQEHPQVLFNSKLYTELLFMDDATKGLHTYEYSTVKSVRDQAQNMLAPPAVQSVSVDRDKDGRVDQWNITMRVKKPEKDFKLTQANVIVAFDYKTDDTVIMDMESLAVAQVHIPAGSMSVSASKLRMQGTLRFKQTSAISEGVNGGIRNIYKDDFFDQLEYVSADVLLKEYVTTRNETTQFDFSKNVQYAAKTDPLANYLEIEMVVAVPKTQNVIYVPQAPYVLKMGWVQFFYVFLFWFILLEKGLLNYLVTMRVFDCTEVNELNVNSISEEK